jgi:hypothetical protein
MLVPSTTRVLGIMVISTPTSITFHHFN